MAQKGAQPPSLIPRILPLHTILPRMTFDPPAILSDWSKFIRRIIACGSGGSKVIREIIMCGGRSLGTRLQPSYLDNR